MVRFGFSLIILLFGASTFTAGVLAPDTIADPVRALASKFYPADLAEPSPEPQKTASSSETPKTIPYESLLEITDKSAPTGIQVGLYGRKENVRLLTTELEKRKLPATTLAVRVSGQFEWYLLASGPFANQQQALLNMAALRELTGYQESYDLIRWPDKTELAQASVALEK